MIAKNRKCCYITEIDPGEGLDGIDQLSGWRCFRKGIMASVPSDSAVEVYQAYLFWILNLATRAMLNLPRH
jgi:hypothetical protein